MAAPRLFGIPASRAPIVAMLSRGPTEWAHVGAWDVDAERYTPGAWLHGVLYPQRCDLSPDGRWLAFFTHHPSASWELGWTYIAISRLPWLSALAAWATDGTWTHGVHFVEDPEVWQVDDPDHGDVDALRARYGLGRTLPLAFSVERRHGWMESDDTPPRDAEHDFWDERRVEHVTMEKKNPANPEQLLTLRGVYGAHRTALPGWGHDVLYAIEGDGKQEPLDGVQWADWTATGRLLVATEDGWLQIRTSDGSTIQWEHDLSRAHPDPQPPPAEASTW